MSDEANANATRVSGFKKFNGSLLPVFILGGQAVFFIATLWLNAGYVSKPAFEAYQGDQVQRREQFARDIQQISVTLAHIDEKMKWDAEQYKKLDDLEARMRSVERMKAP
jgi:hypothetical protein